jgi:hypothetical protein
VTPFLILESAVPPGWYWLLIPLLGTPLYFLLRRPRKRRSGSAWRG